MPKYSCGLLLLLSLDICPQPPLPGGSIQGTVEDSSGAAVAASLVRLRREDAGVQRSAVADADGFFRLEGVPAAKWQLEIDLPGFQPYQKIVATTATGPTEVKIILAVKESKTSVEVRGDVANSVDLSSSSHQAISDTFIHEVPVQNEATGFSEIVTRTTPGVAADGNGFAHPLGEHADTSISLDGQPISDQQAKIFSNQISTSMIQNMDIITGAPPAEYGDKTSLVISVATKSGLGKNKAFGSISSQYGSFGTWSQGTTYGTGSRHWGNFLTLNASGSGRFLDTPEFLPMHDRGNAEAIFDRLDWSPRDQDSLHLNLSAARSWFQTPNTYDSAATGQDQRSQIRSLNIAPNWTHVVNANTIVSLVPYVRFDRSEYFPSADALADRPATLSQSRYLMNTGFRTDLSYSLGRHNAKIGGSYWHTLLRESFNIGVTDPAYNAVCLNAGDEAVIETSLRSAGQCRGAGYHLNPAFVPNLLPYDLTRGGRLYPFHGDADIAQTALYAQDSIRWGRLTINPGLRYDRYNGLSRAHQLQPRLGLAYRTPWTNTVIRLSYARLFETPYNENLIIASEATAGSGSANPFGTFRSSPPEPGRRNQFNAGLGQALGRHLTLDADYFWKFTKNAFDFDSLFLTPITFPIGWRKSKIDGLAARIMLTDIHGFSAYTVMGHTRSRFFGPEAGGLVFSDLPDSGVFRIDHSEEFQQTTFVRYQFHKTGPWTSFSWRFNSGLALPGVVPDYGSALSLTADEQTQMGLYCGTVFATRLQPITSCASSLSGASRVSIPPPGTANKDTQPTRVSPRNLFDASIGTENLLHTERYKLQATFTALNLTNQVALYNFLSTFSGTHFVTPRAFQAELRINF